MTTTNEHQPTATEMNVVSLAEHQRRRNGYLNRLLDLHSRLATTAAERRSHNLPDAWEDAGLLYSVETTIQEQWPEVYEERFPTWIEFEAQLMHNPDQLTAECGICVVIAGHGRVNLTAPEAA